MKKLKVFKKTTSIRSYQKMRKQVFLGLDDKGKKLYVWDFVKLTSRIEVKSPWISQIYWNALDGAFVDSHPGHIAMNRGQHSTRELAPFIRDKYDISHLFYPAEKGPILKCSIEKVTYKEYLEWKKTIEGKYDECRDANIKRHEEAMEKLKQENEQENND